MLRLGGWLLFAATLLPHPTSADDYFWSAPGGGNWHDPNWTTSTGVGSGPPGDHDWATIRTTGSEPVEVRVAPGFPGTAGRVYADSVGAGSLSLRISAGSTFAADDVYLGTEGTAGAVQEGGDVRLSGLFLSRFLSMATPTSSSYELSSGTLTTTSQTQLGEGQTGFGAFRQTGGVHTTRDLFIDNGTYALEGGMLRANLVRAYAGFRQTGGAADIDEITDGYDWAGGSLTVRKRLAPTSMSFPSAPATLASDAFFDFSAGGPKNAGQTAVSLGAHSLFIHPSDFNPATAFASYTNAGIDHVMGTKLVVPAGRTIYAYQWLEEEVECRGTLTVPAAGDDLMLARAFHVYPGGTLAVGGIQPYGSSTVLGGQVDARVLYLGAVSFIADQGFPIGIPIYPSVHQTGGVVKLTALTSTGSSAPFGSNGTYELAGGVLQIGSAIIGSQGFFGQSRLTFVQTAGSHVVEDLLIGSGDGATGEYAISGGSLRADRIVVSHGARRFFNDPIRYGNGTLRITDGAADIHVTSVFQFGPFASLEAVPGATVHLNPAAVVTIASTDPAALAGLANLRLVFDGVVDSTPPGLAPSLLEVAGSDLGPESAGFVENFALGTLEIGGSDSVAFLRLVDIQRNHPPDLLASAEALYVDEVILHPGAMLDLGGLNVYTHRFTDLGGTALGGTMTVVPEPDVISFFGVAGWAGLLRRRPRRVLLKD
jgi:hypothetical protein